MSDGSGGACGIAEIGRDNHNIPTVGFAADYSLVQPPDLTNIVLRHWPVEASATQRGAIVIWHRVDASATASFNHGKHV